MLSAAALVLTACQDATRSVSTGSPESANLGPVINRVAGQYIVAPNRLLFKSTL